MGASVRRVARALTGSVLVTAGAGLIAVPYGALIGLPAAIVGLFMCVPSTLGPLRRDISNARKGMAQALITLGGVALLVACVRLAGASALRARLPLTA